MVFSSIEFMFRFLPIFLIVYFAAAPKYRNIILLIGSLIFYGVGEPSYIILMILSILVNHFAAVNIYTAWKREDDKMCIRDRLMRASIHEIDGRR